MIGVIPREESPKTHTWTCDMCANVSAAHSKQQFSAKRRNPIHRGGKIVCRLCFRQIKKMHDPTAVQAKLIGG